MEENNSYFERGALNWSPTSLKNDPFGDPKMGLKVTTLGSPRTLGGDGSSEDTNDISTFGAKNKTRGVPRNAGSFSGLENQFLLPVWSAFEDCRFALKPHFGKTTCGAPPAPPGVYVGPKNSAQGVSSNAGSDSGLKS